MLTTIQTVSRQLLSVISKIRPKVLSKNHNRIRERSLNEIFYKLPKSKIDMQLVDFVAELGLADKIFADPNTCYMLHTISVTN